MVSVIVKKLQGGLTKTINKAYYIKDEKQISFFTLRTNHDNQRSSHMIDVEQFITRLRINIIRTFPFYGYVLQQMPVVYDNSIQTFGVGKAKRDDLLVKLFISPDYVQRVVEQCKMDNKKVENHFFEIMKHEINHLIFQHLTLDFPDKQRQTIACELSVNSYVDRGKLVPEEGSSLAGVFAEDFGLQPKLGAREYYSLLDGNEKYKKMVANSLRLQKALKGAMSGKTQEQLALDDLAEQQENASDNVKSGVGDNEEQWEEQGSISEKTENAMNSMDAKVGQGHGEAKSKLQEARDLQKEAMEDLKNGDTKSASKKQKQVADKIREASKALGKDKDGSGSGVIDSHEMWESTSGDEITDGMIKDIIRQANEICKQTKKWGDFPGEIMEAIGNAYTSKREVIPWEVVLKEFIASSSENVLGYTMKRRSKRYDTRPGTKKEDILSVAIGIDTSGSINNDILELFFNELRWIDKTGTKMTVFEWDTKVNREYDFGAYDGNITGRGGTDPTDFLEQVSERKFDCIITFTDLYFNKIEKDYNIPMLWVCDRGIYSGGSFDDENYPVDGTIMKINAERDGFEVIRR